jgi:hypothetical protein
LRSRNFFSWRSWRQNTWSPARQLARTFLGVLGGYIRILFWTWYVFAKNAKDACVCASHTNVFLGVLGGIAGVVPVAAGIHGHICTYLYIYPFSCLKISAIK